MQKNFNYNKKFTLRHAYKIDLFDLVGTCMYIHVCVHAAGSTVNYILKLLFTHRPAYFKDPVTH